MPYRTPFQVVGGRVTFDPDELARAYWDVLASGLPSRERVAALALDALAPFKGRALDAQTVAEIRTALERALGGFGERGREIAEGLAGEIERKAKHDSDVG